MTTFAGIDLAWSGRKPTGLCVLDSGAGSLHASMLCCRTLSAEGVFEWLQALGPDVVAGIDAPLIVGDDRRAEAEMARAHADTGLYAYSARWDFLSRHGISAGPELGALLDSSGWNLNPGGVWLTGRHAIEVFPHSIAVSLLGAPRLLRYKKGPRADRIRHFEAWQAGLARLAGSCLAPIKGDRLTARLSASAGELRGQALKQHEDELDAIACALAAWHIGSGPRTSTRIFGDVLNGYIAVPVPISFAG